MRKVRYKHNGKYFTLSKRTDGTLLISDKWGCRWRYSNADDLINGLDMSDVMEKLSLYKAIFRKKYNYLNRGNKNDNS